MTEDKSTQAASSELASRGDSRSQRPTNKAFREFIAADWDSDVSPADRKDVADFTPARVAKLAAAFATDRLVLPAGPYKVRSNDTDYRFRPHSAFAYYSGLDTDREPDSVLVVDHDENNQPRATYYFKPRAPRTSTEFYADSRYGELWVGRRRTLAEVETELGIACRHIDDLRDALAKDVGANLNLRVIRDADPAIEAMVAEIRQQSGLDPEQAPDHDAALAEFASEARLVKDAFEVAQMRAAVDATIEGFAAVVRQLPDAVAAARGERVIEGAFAHTARTVGNGTGYDTIAACGAHACTLHWIRNDGPVREGELVLIDAGVELDSLYTADVTRTLPVTGRFTDVQREIYQAVLDAADAVFAIAKPGMKFKDLHATAMSVIASRLDDWGLLPVSAADSLRDDGQFHRRWMVHGTSHHLGIDVHDCAQARRDMYLDAELQPGMIFTIEPGLYFMPEDLKAPASFRGIGVRIEDDVLVTETGVENLSAALPRTPDEVEAWMATLLPAANG